jgi:DNA-binding NtrC family response regulator
MRKTSVLVVEDEERQRSLLASMLADSDLESEIVSDADEALGSLARRSYDAILSDVRMPGRSGFDLVREARRIRPATPIVLMTGFASVESVVESMRAGACDFLRKPFRRVELLDVLERVVAERQGDTSASGDPEDLSSSLLGQSRAMKDVRALINKVADHPANVLITGESGTGKELVARAIHAQGFRASSRFVAINCAAIPEQMLESELFGHTKGAFTGAHAPKAGLLEIANGGTCLLDEVGELALSLQAKLLRVLEDREVRRLGATQATHIDVRLIAATNRDLRERVGEGSFRQDLFYRLGVIPIQLPPLRARGEDIGILAEHFLEQAAAGARSMRFAPGVVEQLQAESWEGNVRELQNAIERAVALSDGDELRSEDFAITGGSSAPASEDAWVRRVVEQQMPLRELRDRVIVETVRACNGNMAEAARRLGIARPTLYRSFQGNTGGGSEE